MTEKLIIVGASGLGSEIHWLAQRAGIEVQGFLDDRSDRPLCGLPVLGKIDDAASFAHAAFTVAIGSPRVRKSVVEKMREFGVENFITLIDPAAMVGPTVTVGQGAIICAGAMATVNIDIGPFTLLDRGAVVGHDSQIGDFSTIAPLVSVSGNVSIGDGVEVGTGALIRQGLTLGQGSLLGMGAVLLRDLEENEVAVGNPAKTMRFIEQPALEV